MSMKGSYSRTRLRKIAAMMDSPNRAEAISAFRFALDELAKDQTLRFSTEYRGLDPAEVQEASLECARLRAQLATAVKDVAEHKSTVAQLQETIDRLHEEMAYYDLISDEAPEPTPFQTAAPQSPKSRVSPNDSTPFDWGPEGTPISVAAVDQNASDALRLHWSRVVFWLSLPLFALSYAFLSWGAGHMLTPYDVGTVWPLLLFFMVIGAGVALWSNRFLGFASSEVGQWCAEHLESWRSMFLGLCVVLLLWCEAFLALDPKQSAQVENAETFHIIGPFLAAVVTLALGSHVVKVFGWKGLLVKTAFAVEGVTIFTLLVFKSPWIPLDEPMPASRKCLVLLMGLTFVGLVYSESITAWVLEEQKRYRSVVFPGVLLLLAFAANEMNLKAFEPVNPQSASTAGREAHNLKKHRHKKNATPPVEPPPQILNYKWEAPSRASKPLQLAAAYSVARGEPVAGREPPAPSAEPVPSDEHSPGGALLFWSIMIALALLLWRDHVKTQQRKRYEAALREASAPLIQNQTGNAGHATLKDLKSRGWL